jgi:hypothetical protein
MATYIHVEATEPMASRLLGAKGLEFVILVYLLAATSTAE